MPTNDVRIAATGTAAWAVALVVLLLVGLPSEDRWWLWVCVAGIAIGLFAVWYVPRLQRGRARQEAARAAKREREASSEAEGTSTQEDTSAQEGASVQKGASEREGTSERETAD